MPDKLEWLQYSKVSFNIAQKTRSLKFSSSTTGDYRTFSCPVSPDVLLNEMFADHMCDKKNQILFQLGFYVRFRFCASRVINRVAKEIPTSCERVLHYSYREFLPYILQPGNNLFPNYVTCFYRKFKKAGNQCRKRGTAVLRETL